MTDIVERLRNAWGDCHCGTAPLLEAADEIKRLRAALQLILDECEGDDILTAWGIGDVARRALEPKT